MRIAEKFCRLVYHYLAIHQYRPPARFLNAPRDFDLPYPRVLQVLDFLDQFRRNRTWLQLLPRWLIWIADRERLPLPAELRGAVLQAADDLLKADSPERAKALIENLESLLNRFRSARE
jgi:hypothetical protein